MKHSISLMPLNHRSVLTIAVPIMLSNVTEPLIGVVNTAIIGQLPESYYIGAIAVGALIFSFLFWGFGFLRLSTGGLTAQAVGAGDSVELTAVLWRALAIAAVGRNISYCYQSRDRKHLIWPYWRFAGGARPGRNLFSLPHLVSPLCAGEFLHPWLVHRPGPRHDRLCSADFSQPHQYGLWAPSLFFHSAWQRMALVFPP